MFPLAHSQKKLRSEERGPINQQGSSGVLEIRGEISSRVLIEISEAQSISGSCMRFALILCWFGQMFSGTLCLHLRLFLHHLCWSDHGATLQKILRWYFPWKADFLPSISQITATIKTFLNFHKQKREAPLFLTMEPHSQKKDLLLSLKRSSLILDGPWALFCMFPSQGQQWCSL